MPATSGLAQVFIWVPRSMGSCKGDTLYGRVDEVAKHILWNRKPRKPRKCAQSYIWYLTKYNFSTTLESLFGITSLKRVGIVSLNWSKKILF